MKPGKSQRKRPRERGRGGERLREAGLTGQHVMPKGWGGGGGGGEGSEKERVLSGGRWWGAKEISSKNTSLGKLSLPLRGRDRQHMPTRL